MRDRTEGGNPTTDAPGMAMYETTHTSLLEAAKNGNMTAKKWTEFCDRYRDTLVRGIGILPGAGGCPRHHQRSVGGLFARQDGVRSLRLGNALPALRGDSRRDGETR